MLRKQIDFDDEFTSLKVVGNGCFLKIAFTNGTIRTINAITGAAMSSLTLALDNEAVLHSAFDSSGNQLAVFLGDRIEIFRGNVSLASATICEVRCMDWSRNDALLGVGTADGTASIFDAKDMSIRYIFKGHHDIVVSIAFSANQKFLATGCKDKHVRVFSLETQNICLDQQIDRIYAVSFSPDSTLLAAGSDDNIVRIMDIKRDVVLRKIEAHSDYVRAVAFTLDGRKLITGGKDGIIKVIDVRTSEPVMQIEKCGPIAGINQSLDDKQFVIASLNARLGMHHWTL
jgi:WD40 repeat protein